MDSSTPSSKIHPSLVFSTGKVLVADDCACPADGLSLPEDIPCADKDLLRAVRIFLEPVDDEYSVGYSPFVGAGRFY